MSFVAICVAGCGGGGEAGPDAAPCPVGFTLCGSTCVDTDSDNAHCGACNTACEDGFRCDGAGTCALSCQSGLTDCNGTCIDTDSDRNHCGACGAACDAGFICDGAGSCELSCQSGLVDCNGTCIDPETDRAHCGATADCAGANAGTACAAGEVCNGAGTCQLSCQSGLVDCNGTCIDPDTDRAHCGATADCAGANAGTVCAAGEVCNGAGTCQLSCQSGLVDCNGTCIDPDTDRAHCGATADCAGANAGTACAAGEVCNGAGACELSCQSGLVDCSGTCIDPGSNPDFCGAKLDCAGANAGTACGANEFCDAGTCAAADTARTCAEILAGGASTGDGLYTVDIDGIGPAPAQQVFCDMTTSGGGWTRCLAFVNTAAEDVNNNTWLSDCIAYTMAGTTGNSLLVRLRDANGTAVYTTTGTRTVDWTENQVTSTATASSQFDLNQHSRKVTLANGDLLVIPGKSAQNGGCHGSLGNGYGVLIYPAGATNPGSPKMVVLPYRHQVGTNTVRSLGSGNAQWFTSNEISYNGGATLDTCGFPQAQLGTFEIYVR